jgi:CHASE2 domain-containing sensor protein
LNIKDFKPVILLRWVTERPLAWLFEQLGNRFYVGLALVLSVVFSITILSGSMKGMQNQTYDLIMKNRFRVPSANPAVVLIDIDEASLAKMAPEYGRWPWPRSVMAEFIALIGPADPQAIVFDITFVDPDLDHPEADAYFREVVGATPNTFFTMIRLNPNNDSLSELKLSSLAGVHPAIDSPSTTATVAMILPYFYRDLSGNQLGTNNLYSGSDGIARQYNLYRDVAGWRIGSLPANVVASSGRPLPESADVLLNWRGGPGAYSTLSFAPLFTELMGAESKTVAAQFRDKIVIIGSTAPSLFDLKPTPMSQNHPGLEILATAMDNLYTGDALILLPPWIYLLITLSLLALLAMAFVSNVDYRLLNPVFTMVQISFLGISYLFLNYTHVFVDLFAPFAAGLIYFFIARTYSMGLNLRRNGHPFFSMALQAGSHSQVLLVRCQMTGSETAMGRTQTLMLRRVGLSNLGVAAPRMFNQAPLLSTLYSDILVLYWVVPLAKTKEALSDLDEMLDTSIALLNKRHAKCRFLLDAFDLNVASNDTWRLQGKTVLARALMSAKDNQEVIEMTPAFIEVCQSNSELHFTVLKTKDMANV